MMKPNIRSSRALALASVLALAPASSHAAVTIGFNASDPGWQGFMNVSELPENGGAFVFPSGWGVADLNANLDTGSNQLTFTPNTIGDPNEFWYQNTSGTAPDPANPGGPGQRGNKSMEANLFVQNTGGLAGETITFEFEVLADTLTAAHGMRAFIRDFAPDFSSSVDSFVDITGPGDYSVNLTAINDAGRHVQYGFQMTGENVWVTDVGAFGSVVIVPETSVALLGALGMIGLLRRRRD